MATNDPTPVIPTFHKMSTPALSRPADVATYLIRWLFANPGATSSVNENEMMSYRKLVSTYGSDPDALAHNIATMLNTCMNHYFPDSVYTAVCEVEDQEKVSEEGIYQGNKAITISIQDSSGAAIIPHANIIVDSTGEKFDIRLGGVRS